MRTHNVLMRRLRRTEGKVREWNKLRSRHHVSLVACETLDTPLVLCIAQPSHLYNEGTGLESGREVLPQLTHRGSAQDFLKRL